MADGPSDAVTYASFGIAVLSLIVSVAALFFARRDKRMAGQEFAVLVDRSVVHSSPFALRIVSTSSVPIEVDAVHVMEYRSLAQYLLGSADGDGTAPRPGLHVRPLAGWTRPLGSSGPTAGPTLPHRLDEYGTASWTVPIAASTRWVQGAAQLSRGPRRFGSLVAVRPGWRDHIT